MGFSRMAAENRRQSLLIGAVASLIEFAGEFQPNGLHIPSGLTVGVGNEPKFNVFPLPIRPILDALADVAGEFWNGGAGPLHRPILT